MIAISEASRLLSGPLSNPVAGQMPRVVRNAG